MEEQEEANSRKSKTPTPQPLPDQELTVDVAGLSTSHPPPSRPWLDLPDPIKELILQHLPLPDYLRLPFVCRRWRSVQTAHRRRHSPSQPPMRPPLPWLIPGCLGSDSRYHCYSPSDQSFYSLPRVYLSSEHRCIFSCHGWILIASNSADRPFSLVNPVTAATIVLPYVPLSEVVFEVSGAMSAPPADPDCTTLLVDENDVLLYRVNDDLYGVNEEDEDDWTRLHLPLPAKFHIPSIVGSTSVFSGGKFYCISNKHGFYVVDHLLPEPLVRLIDMDAHQIPREQWMNFLVEFDGEVLLAMTLLDTRRPDSQFLGFQVFRPAYSEMSWVRVDSIGDRALFIHHQCCFSLSASDVGCKKNCIYHPKSFPLSEWATGFVVPGDLFEVFDLETGRWIGERPYQDAATEVDFSQFVEHQGIWLLPRLDSISQEE